MKYKCPCCFVRWVDNVKPLDFQRNCLCVFCSGDFEEDELFDWQFDHFKEIDTEDRFLVLKKKIKSLEAKIQDLSIL